MLRKAAAPRTFIVAAMLVVVVIGSATAVSLVMNRASSSASSAIGVTTTTNCSAPDTHCGPYLMLLNTSLVSASTLKGNESRLAGVMVCTHTDLPPPSKIELDWVSPNPVNGGYPVNVTVTTMHIVTTGINWSPTWAPNSQGKEETSYSFMIPNSELDVIRGVNYTLSATYWWSSGPLSHSDPAGGAGATMTAQ